jgi:alpha-L-rhamnosidase
MTEILQKSSDSTHFYDVAAKVKAGFNKHYVKQEGRIKSDCPTVYALAIFFELLDDNHLQPAGDRLSALVREYEYKFATGFAGTPYVSWILTKASQLEEAYKLLLQSNALPGCILSEWVRPLYGSDGTPCYLTAQSTLVR